MARVYPADAHGYCVRGFCPTLCSAKSAEKVARELADNMKKYGFKFHKIIIEK